MLSYLSDIFNALEYKFVYMKSTRRPLSTDAEDDNKAGSSTTGKMSLALTNSSRLYIDDDLLDDAAAGTSAGTSASGAGGKGTAASDDDDFDEDDEDEEMCEKLCTFTVTQKEFINQHWYHCHTCKMLDGVGVCNVCAQVCHKGHDVTYSKHGSFFCDCGANEEGTCKALVKRQPKHLQQQAQQSVAAKRAKRSNKTAQGQQGGQKEKASTAKDRKKLMRISKYWYNSLYAQGKFLVMFFVISI